MTTSEGEASPNDAIEIGALVEAMNADDSNGERFHVGSMIAGRYRVERPIGEGAMGAVALARHVSLDETVAIKFLRPELRRDPVANARLSREAKALARIKSDHVARVLDVGTTLSVGPYMVMEYLEGADLGELLENEGPLPVARAVECVLQVCEALTVAHTAGITHRDIKPQNLFLARHGQFETLKVLDFGIADVTPNPSVALQTEPVPESAVGTSGERAAVAPVYGTPPYMAPERVRDDPTADHRSDIWSVGVVLHELVTGRGVFDAATITETCARIVGDAPIELETNDAVLPASLRAIIARCLMRDPGQRYQSVEELVAALAPLATMHERFRGRSTGAFSRRLLEEELALQSQNAGPPSHTRPRWAASGVDGSVAHGSVAHGSVAHGSVAHVSATRGFAGRDVAGHGSPASSGAGFDGVVEALRRWLSHMRPLALLRSRVSRDRGAAKYVALAAASLLVAGLAASLAGDVGWMTPPPRSSVPIRAEVTPRVERVPRAVMEGVPSPVADPPVADPPVSAASQAAASQAADAPAADAPPTVGANSVDGLPASPTPSRAVSDSPPSRQRERRASPRPSRNAATDADREAAPHSPEARSRERLVRERLVTNEPAKGLEADEPTNKDRAKKARPLPAWLHTFQSKKQDGTTSDE